MKWVKTRHKIVFVILRPVFKIFLRIKYGYTNEKHKLEKGPHLVLFNHVTTLDPFLVAVSFKRPLYFMASDDLFSIKFISPIIRFLVSPIPKSKSFKDIKAIRDTIRVSKEGGIISLSPEGNRTYSGRLANIDPSIIKLIKHLKIPVVLYNITGGFGVKPRFAEKTRRGKSHGRVNRILEYEEYKNLNDDELYEVIRDGLDVDNFVEGQEFKSKTNAEYLERVFYLCPCCDRVGSMKSKRTHLYCEACSLDVEYLPDLSFKVINSPNDNFKFKYIYEYYKYQEDWIYNLDIKSGITYFEDTNVNLTYVVKNKKKHRLLVGNLRITKDELEVYSDSASLKYSINDITGMTVLGKNKINFYIGSEIYQLKGVARFNALKYMQLYFQIKNLEKGVRNEFLGI